jgi:dihydroorotate dehydrogenase (fumarate)
MADLTTSYLGLKLKNPIVAAASPFSKKVENAKRLEDAGIGALVVYSLFEEQIIHESRELDHFLTRGAGAFAEANEFFPDMEVFHLEPDRYVDHIAKLKSAVKVPVIGSLNGVSPGGWTKYAKKIQDAGADALELNLYYLSADENLTAQQIEDNYVALVKQVKGAINIPLAVKLSPFFTSLPNVAKRLVAAGADGLVLFNRFYQPDFDLDNLEVVPSLNLSTSDELRLPLRWTAMLYGKTKADLALTTGVHTSYDVVKSLMAGAKVAMVASEILAHGPARVGQLTKGLTTWMDEHEYQSVTQMIGAMSQKSVAEPAAFERSNYIAALNSWDEAIR